MKPYILLFFLTLFLSSCVSDDGKTRTQEKDEFVLAALANNIEELASTSVCSEAVECKSIAFGSKPCGGPWRYLIYSTSIDTNQLETWVEDYNQKEAAFNTKWGVFSDCSVASPPTSISCENNLCIPIY